MKIKGMLVALFAACCWSGTIVAQDAKPDGTSTAEKPSGFPTIVIVNQSMQTVRVFDRGFRIATVMPGDTAVALAPSRGFRSLSVRRFGFPDFETEEFAFEDNNAWTLLITFTDRVYVNLRP